MVLNKRRIGMTELEITTLGLGCASLAGIGSGVPSEQGRATVRHALELGINYFDTAPQYGFGRSEHLSGDVLRDHASAIVSTKVGRLLRPFHGQRNIGWVDPLPFDQEYDYSYDGIMRSFEDSLQRLGMNRVDILYVHDIGEMTHGAEQNAHYWNQLEQGGYRALRELRQSKTVQAIGLGVNEAQVLSDALNMGDWDVFLLAGRYTLLEQGGAPVLDQCALRGTSVVIGGPFNSGILAGGDTFNYMRAPDDVRTRVRALSDICARFDVPLPAAALQFPLNHPAVTCILPGPRSPTELDQIVAWYGSEIPNGLWEALVDEELLH